jgi:hypothetical protein
VIEIGVSRYVTAGDHKFECLLAVADDWDAEMLIKDVRPSRPDSWEHQFLKAGVPASLTDWRDRESSSDHYTLSFRHIRALSALDRQNTARSLIQDVFGRAAQELVQAT